MYANRLMKQDVGKENIENICTTIPLPQKNKKNWIKLPWIIRSVSITFKPISCDFLLIVNNFNFQCWIKHVAKYAAAQSLEFEGEGAGVKKRTGAPVNFLSFVKSLY